VLPVVSRVGFDLIRPRWRAVLVVAPDPVEYADRVVEDVTRSLQHLAGRLGRMFTAPLPRFVGAEDERRELESRTPQAMATVLMGALLLVIVRIFSEWCGLSGDLRATKEANAVEGNFILRTLPHVTRLPLSYFSLRSSEAIARQVDQADQVSPLFSALSKEIWPDAFTFVAIVIILVSVNWALALLSMLAVPLYRLVTWRMSRYFHDMMLDSPNAEFSPARPMQHTSP
jgi:ABC-type multidrug transport system fused ATPase/permease subunit